MGEDNRQKEGKKERVQGIATYASEANTDSSGIESISQSGSN